ncbi:MAG: methylmalonyl-CoA mutase family protein [Fimbriimonadaceae bacterium]|jgi:methylmalonyl-CoA mutase|nr:methylmalonyl-CoA mutase family protein [Fimbriimonadaceae bacterium]
MPEKLFSNFAPITDEQWLEVVTKDLKGADFEKKLVSTTLDGIKLKPYYRKSDLPTESDGAVRGSRWQSNQWILREEIRQEDPLAGNSHALRSLERGAWELAILTYPAGVQLSSQEDMRVLLQDIWIDAVPIHWISGPMSQQTLALMVNEARSRGIKLSVLQGSVDLDPIIDSCAGWIDQSVNNWKERVRPTLQFILNELPQYKIFTLRGSLMEKAGASLAQELALTLSLLSDYLVGVQDELQAGNLKVPGLQDPTEALAHIASRCEVRLGVGTNYFLEIAKLRAIKSLLLNLLDGFGIKGVEIPIHVVTTSSNKTIYDPHNNILRATVESQAAVIGGCSSLSISAYDQGYHVPDEFSAHIARNTDALLRQEAYFEKVADPLGGSYTVESLTESYKMAAWNIFLQVEEKGGFVKAWEEGFIPGLLQETRDAREKQISTRKRTIIGTTVYPNLKEERLNDVVRKPAPNQAQVATEEIEDLAQRFERGSSFQEWITDKPIPKTLLSSYRPSAPYEELRLRVEQYIAKGGKRPIVRLALIGDLTMRQARAGFSQGFYGVAGYDIRQKVYEEIGEALADADHEGASLLVICTSDDAMVMYAEEAQIVETFSSSNIPVIIAGYPQEHIETLKAAGISGFIHLRSDHLATLRQTHADLGIPPLPEVKS